MQEDEEGVQGDGEGGQNEETMNIDDDSREGASMENTVRPEAYLSTFGQPVFQTNDVLEASQQILDEMAQAGEPAKKKSRFMKAVEVLDMDGNLIKKYESGSEATKALNITQGEISLCCRGLKKSYGGYRFRFSEGVAGNWLICIWFVFF
jgi:hypothetical protein